MRVPDYMDRQPGMGQKGSFSFPSINRAALDNGLKVLLVEDHDLPLVHLQLVVGSGTAQDPPGHLGEAFSTAAMVDEGAGRRSAVQIADRLLGMGTTLVTHVDGDTSTFSVQVLREHLEPALDLMADVLRRPHLAERELVRIKRELQDRAAEQASDPNIVASRSLEASVFGRHPYGRPVLPTIPSIELLERDHLARFHRQHYRPNNVLAVVAGAISMGELMMLFRARFSRWRPGAPRLGRASPPPLAGPRLALVDRPGAPESVIAVGHRGPRRRTHLAEAAEALNMILGGSFTSRLNANLREEHGFTYGVSSSFSMMRSQGLFAIQTSVGSQDTAVAIDQIFVELEAIRARRVTRIELSKAVHLMREELIATAETVGGLAEACAELGTYNLSLHALQRLPGLLDELTPAGLFPLARQLFRPAEATVVVVGDVALFKEQLEGRWGAAEWPLHDSVQGSQAGGAE